MTIYLPYHVKISYGIEHFTNIGHLVYVEFHICQIVPVKIHMGLTDAYRWEFDIVKVLNSG